MPRILAGTNPVDVHVGQRIRERRKELNWSQDQLAAEIGVTFQQVQKYENAQNRVSSSMLFQLAKALKVSIPYFFEGMAEESQPKADMKDLLKAAPTSRLAVHEQQEILDLFEDLPSPARRAKAREFIRLMKQDEGFRD